MDSMNFEQGSGGTNDQSPMDPGFPGSFDDERRDRRSGDEDEWGEPTRSDARESGNEREEREPGAQDNDTNDERAEAAAADDAETQDAGERDAATDDAPPAEGAAEGDDAKPRKRRRRGGRGRSRSSSRSENADATPASERREGDGGGESDRGEDGDDERDVRRSFTQMLINYVPGEECRVAIVEDGKLEELHAERFASASRVGNIYVGKVMNVEPSIQAAFVDFGVGENGFLHVSDLHPRYFPGEDNDTTERVGLKTPRRERPPIQAALRRGDEVIVQVLKEGVGTKGPTVTSYLSIPGRFLVMMPHMDKVGVSRKVEDEDERRKMREILDQLELPDGFGFILRTAGMDRTKAELKRDLAYLMRLWKDMDKRLHAGGKPRLLYSESDLLVRALRDILTNDTNEVIIDNEWALNRAAKFLKIVAPRSSTRLLHYNLKAPLFHSFGIEKQIANIHAREVPLPSGGRLVIDQTEALVAIDVNSGKSRDSRNSEDNAYQTNLEAVDEICRQLRLRDMGGIVINDLIDMRSLSRRREVENRFRERLKRDRAKSTVLPISEFGILQLTRQRMRASHESVHFTDCPTCRGRGMLQKPESVMGDALRQLSAMLDLDRIARIEMVVAPRIAGELLSSKRQLLSRIERTYGKHVDVRISEAVAVDRVTFYAYDASGSDIDVANLPQPRRPANLPEWLEPESASDGAWTPDVDAEAQEALKAELADEPQPDEHGVHPIEVELADEDVELEIADGNRAAGGRDGGAGGGGGRGDNGERGEGGGRRRRRRRGGRGRSQGQGSGSGGTGAPEGQSQHGDRERSREGGHGDRRGDGRGMRRDDVSNRSMSGGPRRAPRHDDANEWGEPPIPGAPAELSDDTGGAETDEGAPMEAQAQPRAGGDGDRAEREQPELGEDGQPKRRRRRRRGRRGRGGGGGAQGEGQAQGAGGMTTESAGTPGDEPVDGVYAAHDHGAADAHAGDDGAGESDDGAEGDAGAEGSAPGGDDGQDAGDMNAQGGQRKRRRRRRRGGRGRNRGGTGDGGGQEREGGNAPRGEGAGDARGTTAERAPMPARESQPTPQPPKPPSTPPPSVMQGFGYGQANAGQPAAKPVRSLYSNVRRKLAPGEIKRRPGGGDE